ncbi:hypothetical protein LAWI1_G002078 [Lachnellula willkommii]|uniref:Uncharacterized protein n=1 Tax=Lachnellula willkommii TaxID=215461 RepID=A0A559MIF9_9HELO|nr:hypothetical protein LAWI1_G002078 [Lachnellula willkommii]
MTFGRPATIPDDYVRLELPLDYDELILSSTTFDPRQQISVQFFNATIGNIGCEGQPSVFDAVTRLFEMEGLLIECKNALPSTLELRQSKDLKIGENADPMDRFFSAPTRATRCLGGVDAAAVRMICSAKPSTTERLVSAIYVQSRWHRMKALNFVLTATRLIGSDGIHSPRSAWDIRSHF